MVADQRGMFVLPAKLLIDSAELGELLLLTARAAPMAVPLGNEALNRRGECGRFARGLGLAEGHDLLLGRLLDWLPQGLFCRLSGRLGWDVGVDGCGAPQ